FSSRNNNEFQSPKTPPITTDCTLPHLVNTFKFALGPCTKGLCRHGMPPAEKPQASLWNYTIADSPGRKFRSGFGSQKSLARFMLEKAKAARGRKEGLPWMGQDTGRSVAWSPGRAWVQVRGEEVEKGLIRRRLD